MGWRGADGSKHLSGEPNPKQWEMYAKNNCVFHYTLPETCTTCATGTASTSTSPWTRAGGRRTTSSSSRSTATRCRSSASPRRARPRAASRPSTCASASRTTSIRCRSGTRRSRTRRPTASAYPLNAITQRPMAMYHSWDSQNAWLRQIHSHNYLYVNPVTARAAGVADGGWCWVESRWGRVRCMVRYSEAVEPGTVWTWNAIGKGEGAWQLAPGADEARKGFLLNHLISDELPYGRRRRPISNSDPITGQAGWYDVRVRLRPAAARGEPPRPRRQAVAAAALPGDRRRRVHERLVRFRRCDRRQSLIGRRPCAQAARARHRPQRLRRLPRLRDSLQGMEHLGLRRAAGGRERLRRESRPARSSTGSRPTRRASSRTPRRSTSRRAACTARTRRACRSARPARATSARRTASSWSTTTSASAASTAPGPARTARASSTRARQVMTKCTLCVDRIYDPTARARGPQAGLREGLSRPTRACSATSRIRSRRSRCAIRERGGYALMPEWETRPANQYLPRRITAVAGSADARAGDARRPSRTRRASESGVLGRRLHDAGRRGAGPRRRSRAGLARGRAVCRGLRHRHARSSPIVLLVVGLGVVVPPPRPAGARLARRGDVAHVVAVARGDRAAGVHRLRRAVVAAVARRWRRRCAAVLPLAVDRCWPRCSGAARR